MSAGRPRLELSECDQWMLNFDVMVILSAAAAEVASAAGAHALTDVTGFGLLGHLHALARESGVGAEVQAAAVPALEGVGGAPGQDGAVSAAAATFTSTPRASRRSPTASSRGASASCARPRSRAGCSPRSTRPDGRGA
jgi:hypothetical protein